MFLRKSTIVFVTQIALFALAFLWVTLIARLLGPEGRGQLALITTFAAFAALISNLGIGAATIYFLNREQDLRSAIVSTALSLQTLLLLLVSLVALTISESLLNGLFSNEVSQQAILAGVLIVLPVTGLTGLLNSVFVGLQAFKSVSVLQILSLSLQVTIVLVLSHFGSLSVFSALVAVGVAPIPSIIIALYRLRVLGIHIRPAIDFGLITKMTSYGVRAWIGNILQYFNYRLDVYIVNFFLGAAAVGIYSVAVSLAELIWYLPTAVSTVLFPKTAKDWNQAKDFTPLVSRNVVLITTAAAVFLGMTGPLVLRFVFGAEFTQSTLPLFALLPGVVFLSVGKVLSSDLAGRNKPHYGTLSALLALGATVSFDLLLIPRLGVLGAGIASTIAYGLSTILTLLLYRNATGNSLRAVLIVMKEDFNLYTQTIGRSYRVLRTNRFLNR